jgi:hypothetical protein
MSTLRSSALVLGEANKSAGPDTVESHMLETKGDAFGPASSSPSALECLEVRLCSQSIETRVLVETPRAAIRFGR